MMRHHHVHDHKPHFLADVLLRCAAVHRVMREGRGAAHLGATTFTRLLTPPPTREKGLAPANAGGAAP